MYDAEFICAFCGATNAITVERLGTRHQSYTEDCQTCCRPNRLTIEVEDEENGEVRVDAERDSD